MIAIAGEGLIQAEKALHQLAERITLLERSLGVSPGTSSTRLLPEQEWKRTSVGAARLEAVRDYIARNVKARQADIVKDLNLNSGSVSVATRALQASGEIEQVGKERNSVIWKSTNEAPPIPSSESTTTSVTAPTRSASP